MNNWLWENINALGWIFWMPCVLVAIKNLFLLSSLDAPSTHLGRAARVFAWLAHIAMMFAPAMNVMGCIALPLMLIANNLLYVQVMMACRAAKGQAIPRDVSFAQRVLSSIVAKQ